MVVLRYDPREAVSLKMGVSGILLLLALASGGCSSTGRTQQQASAGAEPPYRIASEVSKTELEDDGLEAQVPPSPSIRLAPDDPSEPFSPNYGNPVSAPGAAPSRPASQPQTPPAGRPLRSKFAAMDTD